eukprot:jgi/Psemu1/4350/gm1.4350_g
MQIIHCLHQNTPVFTKQHVLDVFADLCSCKITSFDVVFAIDDKLSNKELWCNHAENNIFNPNPITDPNSLSMDFLGLHAITALCTDLDTSESAIPHDLLHMYLNTLGSTKITPAEQFLGHFT